MRWRTRQTDGAGGGRWEKPVKPWPLQIRYAERDRKNAPLRRPPRLTGVHSKSLLPGKRRESCGEQHSWASKQNRGGRRGRRAEIAFWEMKLVKEWHLRKPLLKQMESGEKDALRLSRRDREPRDAQTQEHGGLPLDTKRGITPVNVTYSPKAQLSLQQASQCSLKAYSMFPLVTCLQRRWF